MSTAEQLLRHPGFNESLMLNGNGTQHVAPQPVPKREELPLIITLDQVQPERVSWLWLNRVPIGRLTLLDGDPGIGKSWLSLAVAASVTRGTALPFGEKPKSCGNVLLISCEDGYADTVRPRLDQLGADVSRISIPNPVRGLSLSNGLASFIEQAVKIVGPALVIVDPVIAFAGRRNTDKANDVREFLSPLMGIAQRYSLACLIVRHFTKQSDARAMYRGQGSIDFMAAVRSAFVVVGSEEVPGMRVLAHVKNSLGRKSESIGFHIGESGFRWGEQVDSDADELLQATRPDGRRRDKVQLEAAEQFLRDTLAGGRMPSAEVFKKADSAGIAKRTLWRAKDTLGVVAKKDRGFGGDWFWALP